MDVAFFNFRGEGVRRKDNALYLVITAVVFLLIGAIIGYAFCVKTGRYPPPDFECCGDGLSFDFEFSPFNT